jgi:hypothetical protein
MVCWFAWNAVFQSATSEHGRPGAQVETSEHIENWSERRLGFALCSSGFARNDIRQSQLATKL